METEFAASGRLFRERLIGGYDHDEVHGYIRQVLEAHEAALAEIERLKAAEPLTQVGDDIAGLLTTFAETVATRRDDAKEDIERTRREAEAYAEEKRVEADRLVTEARLHAQSVGDELLAKARQEVAATAEQWATASASLETAAGGIAAALSALRRLVELPAAAQAAEQAETGEHEGRAIPARPVFSSARDAPLLRELLRQKSTNKASGF